jgi:hypothetical protein
VLSARIGITPDEFYYMTPFELSCFVDAFNIRQDEKRQELIVLAYTTAALARTEKMPSLQSLLETEERPQQNISLTDEDILTEIRRMNAAAGGVEV